MEENKEMTGRYYREIIDSLLSKIHSDRALKLIYRFVQSLYINEVDK